MTWPYDPEAIYQDADFEQAAFEEEGRRYSSRVRRMLALRKAGKLAEAAAACPHSCGYPLNSPAARNDSDPRAGQDGFRCTECGSVLSGNPWGEDCTVTYPCDWVRD